MFYFYCIAGDGVFEWKGSIHSTNALPSVRIFFCDEECLFNNIIRAWKSRNWCSDHWVEYAYLRGRASIMSEVEPSSGVELYSCFCSSKFKLLCFGFCDSNYSTPSGQGSNENILYP